MTVTSTLSLLVTAPAAVPANSVTASNQSGAEIIWLANGGNAYVYASGGADSRPVPQIAGATNVTVGLGLAGTIDMVGNPDIVQLITTCRGTVLVVQTEILPEN